MAYTLMNPTRNEKVFQLDCGCEVDLSTIRPTFISCSTHEAASGMEIKVAKLKAEKADLLDLLKAAVARIQLANSEGDDILSAWLIDAQTAISEKPI